MIPRILHQIWVGPDPLPKEFGKYQKTWSRLHPDWELRLWTEDNFPTELRRDESRERLRVPAERSDILRHDVLYRFGGVYADVDFEWRKPIDELLEGIEIFTAWLKPAQEKKAGRVNNALIGAVPGHPLIDRALRELKPREYHGLDKRASGSLFWDALVQDTPGVTIFPVEYFYPDSPEQRASAYAIHHSARSWKDDEGFRKAALLAEERLDKVKAELEQERRNHEATKKELTALRDAASPADGAEEAVRRRSFSFRRSR